LRWGKGGEKKRGEKRRKKGKIHALNRFKIDMILTYSMAI